MANLLVIFETLTGFSRDETLAKFAGQGYGTRKREVSDVAVEKVGEIQQRLPHPARRRPRPRPDPGYRSPTC